MDVTAEGVKLIELAKGVSLEQIRAATGTALITAGFEAALAS
jgi:3-oxoacid CoA-transferase subunit B